MLVGGSITQRFSSSFLLCEHVFILGETSCVTAIEGSPTRSVFPKLPGRLSCLRFGLRMERKCCSFGPLHCCGFDALEEGAAPLAGCCPHFRTIYSASISLIIPPLWHRQHKAFSTVLSKEEQQCRSWNNLSQFYLQGWLRCLPLND